MHETSTLPALVCFANSPFCILTHQLCLHMFAALLTMSVRLQECLQDGTEMQARDLARLPQNILSQLAALWLMNSGPSESVMQTWGYSLIETHPQQDTQVCCLNHVSVAVRGRPLTEFYNSHTTLCCYFISQPPILDLPTL